MVGGCFRLLETVVIASKLDHLLAHGSCVGGDHALENDQHRVNENGAVTNDYRPLLRKTRRLLEAFFTVDAELVKRMLPDLQIPW